MTSLLSTSSHCLSTSQQVEIADPVCPIWFSKGSKEREQAIALSNIGFSYLGEDENFSIESDPLATVGEWVFYSVDNCLVIYFDESRWSSNLPPDSLSQVLSILNQHQQQEDNRFRIETLIGLASNIESYQPDQISYALEAIAKWMNRYHPQSSPVLNAIIEELSHE